MRQTVSGLVVVGFALSAVATGDQVRPNFSGNWALASSVPDGSAALGTDLVISQDAKSIQFNLIGIGFQSVSTDSRGTATRYPVRITYELDGAEHSSNVMSEPPMPSPPPPRSGVMMMRTEESTSKATWAGDELVIVQHNKIRTTAPGHTPASVLTRQTIRQALSLEASGALVVESLIVADPDPWGRKSSSPTPVRSIYEKK